MELSYLVKTDIEQEMNSHSHADTKKEFIVCSRLKMGKEGIFIDYTVKDRNPHTYNSVVVCWQYKPEQFCMVILVAEQLGLKIPISCSLHDKAALLSETICLMWPYYFIAVLK